MSIGKAKNNLEKANTEKIGHRKGILKELTGKSINKLAVEAGISNGTADDWSDNQIEKPSRTVLDFLKHYAIREEWWTTGNGEVFDEKPTSVQKPTDNTEMNLDEAIKRVIEGHTEYVMIPRIVLQDSMLVSKQKIEDDKKLMDKILDLNERLIARVLDPQLPGVQKS